MKRLRQTRTMGGRGGALCEIYTFSLSLSSRHKCSVGDVEDIITE